MLFRCFAACAALLAVTSLPAADDPLDAFPAETGVVLRLAAPNDLTDKSRAFLKNAAPQFASLAGQLGPGLGSLIGNPTLGGIDPARPWYVAVLPRPQGAPALVFAAPTTDAAALKKAVGQGYTFADYEKWVIYSLDAEAVKKVQARIGGEGKAIREALGGAAGEVFAKGDAAVFLNIPLLREAYKPQIEEGRTQLAKAAELPAGADPATRAGMEYNRKALEALLKAVDDMTSVAASAAIGEKSLTEEILITVAPGSRSAEFLAKQTPSDFPLMAKLPRGRVAYYALAGDLTEVIDAWMQTVATMVPQNEELKKRLEELKNFQFGEVVGLLELGDLENGIFRGVTVAEVDSPEKYLALAREMVKAMGHLEAPGVQEDITLQPEAETIDGVKIDLMKVVMTPDPNAGPTGPSQKFVEVMFGKEGLAERIAVAESLFVQTIGPQEVMSEALAAVKGNVAGDEAAAKAADAAKSGLGKANVLVLLDVPRLLGGGLRLAIASGQVPLPIDPKAFEAVKLVPGYTAASLAAGPTELRARGVIPADQVRGMVDLLGVLQQAPRRNRAQ